MPIASQAAPDPKLANEQSATLFEDFFNYVDAGLFTKYSVDGSGTTAWSGTAIDTNSGASDTILSTTAATAWDGEGIYQTDANLLPIAANPCVYAECYCHVVGVHASGSAMQFFGLASAHAILPTSNVDPSASYSGAIIYKLSGDSYWRVQTSNGNAKTTVVSNMPVVEGANKFRIDVTGFDGNNCQVTFKVNNQLLKDSNNLVIAAVVPYASLAKMGLLWLVESDTNAAAQTGQLDYIASGRFRSLLNA
ncbi:MAG TPA: hypothetical protein VHX65_16890 [Pirellulales bacterium]|jgi:hypothetical protein|nr:hypothetical protein [Pirellulales bacterium]